MCIVAIGMVSDLCRAITSSISVHMDNIMMVFFEILAVSIVERGERRVEERRGEEI